MKAPYTLGGYVLVLLLLLGLGSSTQFQLLDLRLRDASTRWLQTIRPSQPQETSPPIVVVGLTDEDLTAFGVPAALLHRELGGFLEAMAIARPAVVGVDILLPANSFDSIQPGLDAALARGMIKARLATPLVFGIGADADGHRKAVNPLFSQILREQQGGFVFVNADADGVIRRFDERIGEHGESLPTLAGVMARILGRDPRAGSIHYGDGPPFSFVPLGQVLGWLRQGDRAALEAHFAGHAVLLGSMLAFEDLQRTPVALGAQEYPGETSHGVFVHAQLLRNLLQDNLLQPLPLVWEAALVALLCLTWWLRPSFAFAFLALMLAVGAATAGAAAVYWNLAVPSLLLAVAALAGFGCKTAWHVWCVGRERHRLRTTFGGFVSPAVMDAILKGQLDPGREGARKDVCVLFADIRGFTALSESLPPESVTVMLNRYFDRMVRTIHAHYGTLDKFIGDGLMAIFGSPLKTANPCADGLACAMGMVEALQAFNDEQLRLQLPPLRIGIGLHYGSAVIGYVGSKDRYEYSAIGDTVNTASRIEGLTKSLGYTILLSDAVVNQVGGVTQAVQLGDVSVRGHSSIELFGMVPVSESNS